MRQTSSRQLPGPTVFVHNGLACFSLPTPAYGRIFPSQHLEELVVNRMDRNGGQGRHVLPDCTLKPLPPPGLSDTLKTTWNDLGHVEPC